MAIPFFLSEKFTSNPTLVVMGFRRQLVYHLHFWACLAVAPLIVVQWLHQNYLLSALLFLFCANALLVIGFLRFRQHYFLRGWLFPLLAMICAVYSTAINGHAGLYWATLAESLTNQIKLCERYDRYWGHHQRWPDASLRQRDLVSLAQACRPGTV